MGLKWQGCEDGHAHLFNAELKNEWRNVAAVL